MFRIAQTVMADNCRRFHHTEPCR